MDYIEYHQDKVTPWQIVILFLSVYVLVALFYEAISKPPEDIQYI